MLTRADSFGAIWCNDPFHSIEQSMLASLFEDSYGVVVWVIRTKGDYHRSVAG